MRGVAPRAVAAAAAVDDGAAVTAMRLDCRAECRSIERIYTHIYRYIYHAR